VQGGILAVTLFEIILLIYLIIDVISAVITWRLLQNIFSMSVLSAFHIGAIRPLSLPAVLLFAML